MIINLTQHAPTPEQELAGVGGVSSKVQELLTFEDLPSCDQIAARAAAIAEIAATSGAKFAMIGGAPFLMPRLEAALIERRIQPLYAFSRRESVETTAPDGSIRKTSVFRHIGFVVGGPPTTVVIDDSCPECGWEGPHSDRRDHSCPRCWSNA